MESSSQSGSRPSIFPGGTVVASRYTIESIIGEGMSGVVYRARRDDGELVALKVISSELCADDQIRRRFRREAQILKRLEGQHVVRLHDLVDEDGRLIIVLEHVDGTPLDRLLKESPPSMDQAIEIALQICAALGAAHAAGVVHRDLKPANVLIERFDKAGSSLSVRVVDFGLSKVVRGDMHISGSLTERDMIFGTPEYMAPEQVRGDEVDLRADIYAAGVILHEMIVGEVPHKGGSPIETMAKHLSGEVARPRVSRGGGVVPPGLAAVIVRALAKAPADRYPSARALAEAITASWGESLVITPRGSEAPRGIEDPESLATIDTELNVATQGLSSVDATPGPIVVTAVGGRRSGRSTDDEGAALTLRSPEPGGGDRIFWIAAVVIAVLCIALGVWFGVR